MTTLSVHTPTPVNIPRAAPLAADLFLHLWQLIEAGSRAMAESRRRARRQQEVRTLRQFARRQSASDPRFAAELLAAADRHEQGL